MRTTAKRRRNNSSRGATMVEFAIVSIALFTLIFGIIEGGFAVRARSTVNNAVDEAARTGAVAGTSSDADYRIVQRLVDRGIESANVEYVVVYKAATSSSPVPAACVAGDGQTVTDVCNVYKPDADGQFTGDASAYACVTWCGTTRLGQTGINYLGVYVQANYQPILNQIFFEFKFDVNSNSVQAIETSGDPDDDGADA